jgi:hypothetical protein
MDFEGGYSDDDDGLAGNVARLLDLGVIGIDFEDRIVKGSGLYDIDRQADRIATVRKGAEQKGVELALHQRADGPVSWPGQGCGTVYRRSSGEGKGIRSRGRVRLLHSRLARRRADRSNL